MRGDIYYCLPSTLFPRSIREKEGVMGDLKRVETDGEEAGSGME